jgi:hypothetical protein
MKIKRKYYAFWESEFWQNPFPVAGPFLVVSLIVGFTIAVYGFMWWVKWVSTWPWPMPF